MNTYQELKSSIFPPRSQNSIVTGIKNWFSLVSQRNPIGGTGTFLSWYTSVYPASKWVNAVFLHFSLAPERDAAVIRDSVETFTVLLRF